MKMLLAVFSCHRYVYSAVGMCDWLETKRIHEDRISALRSTWLQDAAAFGFDYRIFKGRGGDQPQADEVFLECGDDYYHSADKMLLIVRWALDNGYDYIFKVDDDSFVHIDRLRSSGFEDYDYIGRMDERIDSSYLPGGPGYWLSRRAMERLALIRHPQPWQEDVWVGKTLTSNGFDAIRDPRYFCAGPDIYVTPEQIAEAEDRNCIALTACTTAVVSDLYRQYVVRSL